MAQGQLRSLIERNNIASKTWQPMPEIKAMRAMIRRDVPVVIVTCLDARADPTMYLGLGPGEIPIIRNAGGRVTEDVLRSLEILSTIVNIGMVVVVHHTDCGGMFISDDDVRSKLSERWPEHAHMVEHKTWNSFHDIGMDQSIRDDVSILKNWKFLAEDTAIGGYVFDIESGKLHEVVAATSRE